jgi:cob(I)alamin adenosyltransferase
MNKIDKVGSVKLAHAIRQGMPRFAAANTTYQTNVVTVNTYVNNVLSSSLPTVVPQPLDWQDYVTAWEAASNDALTWVNQCMAKLLGVPQDVQSYNSVISALLNDAIMQTNTLMANPSNAAALATLNNDLTQIPGQLQLVETFISGCITSLQHFQDVLPAMAAQLQTLSTKAAADNKADQAQIAALQADIQKLQNDINNLTASIIGLGIADAVALTLGTISSIVLFPEGLLTWFVMGPIVAITTTYIALDAKQIIADKDAIKADQGQMSQLTAACSVLSAMSTNYATLANESQTIQTALQAVLSEWQALSADIATAVSDIQTAVSDTQAANYSEVLADLQAAQTEWNAANAQAGSLVLSLNVNAAPLTIGMSASQVQSTLAQGQTQDLITYFNSVNA